MNFKMPTPHHFFVLLMLILFTSCEDDPFNADSGTFTDKRDNHKYKWVKIGEQIWMAENLAYIPYACAPDSQCGIYVYDYYGKGNFSANYSIYGCLYDWKTAIQACPEGWHLPSDDEWIELESYLGMDEDELYDENVRRGEKANVAGKLGAGSSLWNELNENSTNESGFSALPGGFSVFSTGNFAGINDNATFWTATYDDYNNWIRYRAMDAFGILRFKIHQGQGQSVRCLKD